MASTSNSEKPPVSDVEKDRTRLCEEFAAIAGTDSAVAQCYLAENDWEMEVQTPGDIDRGANIGRCDFYLYFLSFFFFLNSSSTRLQLISLIKSGYELQKDQNTSYLSMWYM